MMDVKVLIIDNDEGMRRLVHRALEADGYSVIAASNALDGIEVAETFQPQVVILNWTIADDRRFDTLEQFHVQMDIPVIVISNQDDDQVKVAALNAGADDYLSKPFSVQELKARIRVILRRTRGHDGITNFTIGQLEIDPMTRQVKIRGDVIQLTPTEYAILELLAQYAGCVISYRQLWQHIRGNKQFDSHTLHVHLSNLRQKIEHDSANPQWIKTEPHVGYRLNIVT